MRGKGVIYCEVIYFSLAKKVSLRGISHHVHSLNFGSFFPFLSIAQSARIIEVEGRQVVNSANVV
jgi:hypothetical protein